MKKYTLSIITVSDRGSRGEREDKSGEVIKELMSPLFEVVSYVIIPDEKETIKETILASVNKVDLILTNGGTGLHPRDQTPDATLEIIERQIPGIAEAIRAEGAKRTKTAILSRAVAGTKGKTLIINLPGSPKAVRESIEAIIDVLPHAIDKLKGDPSECGS